MRKINRKLEQRCSLFLNKLQIIDYELLIKLYFCAKFITRTWKKNVTS